MAAPKKSPATKQAAKAAPATKQTVAAKPSAARSSVTAKRSAASTAPAKKTPATKSPATKSPTKKTPVTKTAATKSPATKSTTRNAAKKTAAAKTPAKQTPAKQSPAKQTPAKTAAAKSATTTKAATTSTPSKSVPAKRPATKAVPSRSPAAKSTSSRPPTSSRRPLVRHPSPDTPALLSNYRPDRHEIPPPRGTSKDGITYTKDFDVKFLKTQRDDLIERRRSELARATRLEDEATSLIEDGEMGDVQFDDEGGEGDTMVVQRDLDRVLSTQARQTISEIDAALARIENGTYGYSEVSGLPIPRERLEALPETTVLAAEKVSGIGPR
jgi:RNA polymerase-binding transcription factor DksA